MKNVTLRQLKTFECVARNLSYSRAAEELFLTQPAVSMQIKQLEEQLGTTLLEQTGKKISLTPAGGLMLSYSREILGKCLEADQSLKSLKSGTGQPLKVGVTTSGSYFFPRLLNEFSLQHSGTAYELIVATRDVITKKLEDGELDIAVMANAPDTEDIVVEYFAPHNFVLVASPNHPLSAQSGLTADDLSLESFITRERGTDTRTVMSSVLNGRVDPAKLREFPCTEAIKQAVMAGMGIALLSAHAVRLELQSELLNVLDVEGFPVQRNWTIAYVANRPLSPVCETFRKFLTTQGAQLIEHFSSTALKPQAAATMQASAPRRAFLASRTPSGHTATGSLRRNGMAMREGFRGLRASNANLFTAQA
jgi:DNA-binding transcriptional LysR family regulator